MENQRPIFRRAPLGFTLIESLVVVAILALLMSVALPSFNTVVRKFRLNAAASALSASLQQARSEAIKANSRVLVCPKRLWVNSCTSTSDWAVNGWIVCYDLDGDDQCDASSAQYANPIIVSQGFDAELLSITGPQYIRFNPDGTQGPMSAATAVLTLRGAWSDAVDLPATVSASGLVKVQRP
jgi:prepilin-type N-terminal cleavage/methylation domain-containing protein